jgi:hypothetical protein
MLNRGGYGMWPPAEQLKFQNPMNFTGFVSSSSKPLGRGGGKWKGKKVNIDQRKESYKPPALQELQYQNKMKARRYFPKKKFNNRSAPYAPRNTTSFIIRAKKDGGITSLVSPCPVTPAILPTPIFSPSREALVDTAKEEWGVDGYGSMKGLIRLRSPGNDLDVNDDEEEDDGGSSESDVEEHMEVERRLDHDLSRFEMIYPNYGAEYNNVLENRVDDQDTHIAQVEEENLILKERLFLMEREMADLRRRLISLERLSRVRVVDENNEEVVENDNENESDNDNDNDNESDSRGGYSVSVEDNNDEVVVENSEIRSVKAKEVINKVQEGESVVAKEDNNVVDSVVKDVKEGSSSEAKDENNTESVVKDDKEGRLTEANEEKIVVEENKESQISEAKEVNNVVEEDICMEDLEHAADEKDGEENKNESFEKEHLRR